MGEKTPTVAGERRPRNRTGDVATVGARNRAGGTTHQPATKTRNEKEFEFIRDRVTRLKQAFIERLQKNVEVQGQCVVWTGTVDHRSGGYARLHFAVKHPRRRGERHQTFRIGAHRLFLILRLGRPIAEGMEAGHYECHNPLCMRHVEEQTRQENMLRQRERKQSKDSPPF